MNRSSTQVNNAELVKQMLENRRGVWSGGSSSRLLKRRPDKSFERFMVALILKLLPRPG